MSAILNAAWGVSVTAIVDVETGGDVSSGLLVGDWVVVMVVQAIIRMNENNTYKLDRFIVHSFG